MIFYEHQNKQTTIEKANSVILIRDKRTHQHKETSVNS